MDTEKLAIETLRYLYRNQGMRMLKDMTLFFKKKETNMRYISNALMLLENNGYIIVSGIWRNALGGVLGDKRITLEQSHISARITEAGKKYYEDKHKFEVWIKNPDNFWKIVAFFIPIVISLIIYLLRNYIW